jgi:hypothetical protein
VMKSARTRGEGAFVVRARCRNGCKAAIARFWTWSITVAFRVHRATSTLDGRADDVCNTISTNCGNRGSVSCLLVGEPEISVY